MLKPNFARLLAAPLLALSLAAAAQGPANDEAITAVRLSAGESITLDGSLAHPAWRRAPVWNRFVEKDPRTGAPPPEETRVQVLFDERALYVGVTVLDKTPERIRDLPVRYDQVNRTQDFVVAYIDPIGNKRSAQFFRVNAAGSLADGIHTASDDSEDFAPDFDWDAAVQRNAQGWTAVLRLPFASLRYADGVQGADGRPGAQPWRIMVARRIPRENFHLVSSVLIPRDAPSFIHTLQPLQGVTLPPRPQFLTVRPSLTLRNTRLEEAGAQTATATRKDNDIDASLDLKWRPRAELVIDGTLNPDFSQVALDVPQLAGNSRFALFFPEKRPFFFESADLLRTPSDALYTRTFTAPRWGLRGTWRGPSLAGTALLVDDRGGGLVSLPEPYGTGYAAQPASRTLAARAKHEQGAFGFGGIVAARRYAKGVGDNDVLGPDLAWQFSDTWRLRGQWLRSDTTAVPDGGGALVRGRSVSGERRLLRLQRNATLSETSLVFDDIGHGFRHDSGFVNQAGTRQLSAFHGEGWEDVGPFHLFFVNLNLERITDRSTGELVKQDIRPGWWGASSRNLEWFVELHPWTRTRTRAGGPLLDERYVQTGLVMTPAVWWPLVDTNLSIGRLADAAATASRRGVRWVSSARLRPLRALELEPNVSLAWLEDAGQRRYHETATQLLAVWHLGPGLNLRWIHQRSSLDRRAEPGVTAERWGQAANSLTFTWRRSAGTVLYVGASQARTGRPVTQRETEAFVKLQVDVDEVRALF